MGNFFMADDILKDKASGCRDGKICGWGSFPEVEAQVCPCEDAAGVASFLQSGGAGIPFGLGRSYGDSALGRQVLLMPAMAQILDFDVESGTINCQAGLSLAKVLAAVVPRGWILPVLPGTCQVTVGGAIASDVHGKNHHLEGSFGDYVSSLSLMLPDGEIVECSSTDKTNLFRATCGGMGLTGVILSAKIRLKRIDSCMIQGRVMVCHNLEELLAGFSIWSDWTYLVAWLDSLSLHKERGRFLLLAGRHDQGGNLQYRPGPSLLLPSFCPGGIVNRTSLKIFNTAYFSLKRRFKTLFTIALDQFFFPLDRLANWNRLYGKQGFLQYQLVLPEDAAPQGLRKIFDAIACSVLKPTLAVLKLLGRGNDNFLSFHLKGYTLALDYKVAPGLFPFLERLDRIVLECGGRLYLAKDARMPEAMVRAGYPGLTDFIGIRERYRLRETFQSRQSLRLHL